MTVTIDRLAENDWQHFRDIRLRALADAPEAFWATLDDESAYTIADWTHFLRHVTWFLARRDGRSIGMAGGLRRAEPRAGAAEPEVIGMWVEPDQRGTGVAGLLLRAVLEWARETDARFVTLSVVEGNTVARTLYERHGFRGTGERTALPRDASVFEERMLKSLLN